MTTTELSGDFAYTELNVAHTYMSEELSGTEAQTIAERLNASDPALAALPDRGRTQFSDALRTDLKSAVDRLSIYPQTEKPMDDLQQRILNAATEYNKRQNINLTRAVELLDTVQNREDPIGDLRKQTSLQAITAGIQNHHPLFTNLSPIELRDIFTDQLATTVLGEAAHIGESITRSTAANESLAATDTNAQICLDTLLALHNPKDDALHDYRVGKGSLFTLSKLAQRGLPPQEIKGT